MTCEWITLPDGTQAMVCGRGGRRKTMRCSVDGCSEFADYQCDRRINTGRKSGTCDAWICEQHRVMAGHDIDYCPEHATQNGRQTTQLKMEL